MPCLSETRRHGLLPQVVLDPLMWPHADYFTATLIQVHLLKQCQSQIILAYPEQSCSGSMGDLLPALSHASTRGSYNDCSSMTPHVDKLGEGKQQLFAAASIA